MEYTYFSETGPRENNEDSLRVVTASECNIDFSVHSVEELQDVIAHVNAIRRVDEVRRRELK